MLPSLTNALKTLRRSSAAADPSARDDDLDLVAFINESRSDSERRQLASMASMRHRRS